MLGDVLCHRCGTFNKNIVTFCNRCGDPVGLQLKYDVAECEERGMTYAAPLKVTIRLTVFDKDPETGNKTIRDIKEQEVFFGEIPLMTENGTFIINGTERVIVSQLHRSPGVFFERLQAQGYFLGKIIPYRGSWVEFEYDNKNLLYVRIDRKRKFYGTVFLRALGLRPTPRSCARSTSAATSSSRTRSCSGRCNDGLIGLKLSHAITSKSGDTVVPQGRKITNRVFKEIQKAKIEQVEVASNDLEGAYVAADVIDMYTGEVLVEANHELTATTLAKLIEAGIPTFEMFFPELDDVGNVISVTLQEGRREGAERRAARNLPQAAARRSADGRHRHAAVPGDVLRPAQVRFLARGPHEVQHQAARQDRRNLRSTSARSIRRTSSTRSSTC